MVVENSLRAMLREHAKVVRAARFGSFQHTLQGPRPAFTFGQIFDGANAIQPHPDLGAGEPGEAVPGQGWGFSTFEFFMTIIDDGGNTLTAESFTSIPSVTTQEPSIIAVEAAGSTPTGIARWEAQSANPAGDTISIPAVPSDPLTDVVEFKFTLFDDGGPKLKLAVRNLQEREYVIREPDNFNFDKVDYAIRALFFNSPAGVELSLDSVRAEISYGRIEDLPPRDPVVFPLWNDRTGAWNLVSAL